SYNYFIRLLGVIRCKIIGGAIMKNILGRKVGMTQIFQENGDLVPVTVVEAGPLVVVQKRTMEKDGYNAIQVGFEDMRESKLSKQDKSHINKVELEYKRYLREFRVEESDEFEIGQEIKVDIFEEGDKVDVIGRSKGKGTEGVIKRHGFARGRETHGSRFHRSPGGMSAATRQIGRAHV